jgi:hypothetical protein
MPLRDPPLLGKVLYAMAGAALYGLYTLAVLRRDGRPVTVQDLLGVGMNLICALFCGVLLTMVFADRIAGMIPWTSLKDAGLVAFAFGALGWELLPLMFPKALRWAEKKADALAGREGGQ